MKMTTKYSLPINNPEKWMMRANMKIHFNNYNIFENEY